MGLPLQAVIACSLLDSGLPAWSAQFLGLVASENVFNRHRETEFKFIMCGISSALICRLPKAALDEKKKQAG